MLLAKMAITWYAIKDFKAKELSEETFVSNASMSGAGAYRAADIVTSVKNHLIGFCAEKARKNGTIESVDAFMESYGLKNEY